MTDFAPFSEVLQQAIDHYESQLQLAKQSKSLINGWSISNMIKTYKHNRAIRAINNSLLELRQQKELAIQDELLRKPKEI